MTSADRKPEPQTFVFLLVPGFSMMSLSSAIEPLRSLNRLAGFDAYQWRLASLDGGAVEASNGISFATVPYAQALDEADYVFVCGGLRILESDERRYLAALRQAARRRIPVGSLSTGSYLLARAGLLAGYRCTIHWENRSAFQEDFPDLDCTNKIYEIDRERLTCSGGTAAMDMMLHLIVDRHGSDLARGVANQFHHERIRDEREEQRGGRLEVLAQMPEKVRQAIGLMQRHIENPLPMPEIGRRILLSPRQLERLFSARGRHVSASLLHAATDRARPRTPDLFRPSHHRSGGVGGLHVHLPFRHLVQADLRRAPFRHAGPQRSGGRTARGGQSQKRLNMSEI